MRKFVSILSIISLLGSLGVLPYPVFAQEHWGLPAPGTMVHLSSSYVPVLIKGIKVHPQNPLLFDFIIDSGQSGLDVKSISFKTETERLIKYFLTSLTIQEDDLWVNLSPYEKDRIIPDALSKTELGRDMLAQDYLLKQLSASLIYPEDQLGKNFWDKVYAQAREKFGTTDVSIDTFNKVWIIADKARVLERNNVGYVVGTHLKVLLEEDYFALAHHGKEEERGMKDEVALRSASNVSSRENVNTLGSRIVREIIIPELEKEVNEGRNFAPLRQMYYAMILAAWYKMAIKDALLNKVYSNKNKTAGILSDDSQVKERIYQQYLNAFKRGVFNYIKEDLDAVSQKVIPRKYFSGGERIFQVPSRDLIERVTVLGEGDQMMTGQQAQATVQMDNHPDRIRSTDVRQDNQGQERNTSVSDLFPGKKDLRDVAEFPALSEQRKEQLINSLLHPVADADFSKIKMELIQSQDQSLVPLLLDALSKGEKTADVVEVLGAIGRRSDPSVKGALLSLLKSEDAVLKKAAAQGLGKVGDPTTIPAVIEALKGDDTNLVSALKEFYDPQTIDPLINVIKKQNILGQQTKKDAIWALIRFADPRVKDVLLDVLENENDSVVLKEAIKGLRDPRAVVEMIRLLQTKRDLRPEIIVALRQIGDPAAIDALLQFYDKQNFERYTGGGEFMRDLLYRDVVLLFSRLAPKANPDQITRIKGIFNTALTKNLTRNEAIVGLLMLGDREQIKGDFWNDFLDSSGPAELFENVSWEGQDKTSFDDVLRESFKRNKNTGKSLIEQIAFYSRADGFFSFIEQVLHWLELEEGRTDLKRLEDYQKITLMLIDHMWVAGLHREGEHYLDNEALVSIVPKTLSIYHSLDKNGRFSLTEDGRKIDQAFRLAIKLMMDARIHDDNYIHASVRDGEMDRMSLAKYYLLGTEQSPGILRKISLSEGGLELISHIVNDSMDEEEVLKGLKTVADDEFRPTAKILFDDLEWLINNVKTRLESTRDKDLWRGYHQSLDPILDELKKQVSLILPSLTQPSEQLIKFINILAGSEKEAGDATVRELIGLNDPASIPLLIQLLSHKDRSVRLRSMRVLHDIDSQDPNLVAALMDVLTDNDPDVSGLAAETLGRLGSKLAVGPLIAKAITGSVDAIESLGKLKDSRAVPALLRILSDNRQPVFNYAAKSLGEIGGPEAVKGLLESLDTLSTDAETLLTNNKDNVFGRGHEISAAMTQVVMALRRIGDHQTIDPLLKLEKGLMFKKYSSLRKEVISALSRFARVADAERKALLIQIFQNGLTDIDYLTRQASAAGILMIRNNDLITDAVMRELFNGITIRILVENMVWDQLGAGYLDDVFIRGFKQFPNASQALQVAMNSYVHPELFHPLVEQILHWLDLKDGARGSDRMENLGQIGFLVLGHLWKIGLHSEDGLFLDHDVMMRLVPRFISVYQQWQRQEDISDPDQRKYNSLLRLMVKLMADGRVYDARYVEANRQDLMRKNLFSQGPNGSNSFPSFWNVMSVSNRQELEKIITEDYDINFVLADAGTIQNDKYRIQVRTMIESVRKTLASIEAKTNNNVWLEYQQANQSILDQLKGQTAVNAANVQSFKQSPGGIDLSPKNLDLNVDRAGSGVEMGLDPGVVAEFERGDFSGVFPVILRITPIASPLSLLGLESSK